MGKTHTKKIEARTARLHALPRSERLHKSALIKKKEGRVLDAAEKHALMMTSEYGEVLKLWEVLRTINSDGTQGLSEAQEKRKKKLAKNNAKGTEKVHPKTGAKVTKLGDSDLDSDQDEDAEEEPNDHNDTDKKSMTRASKADHYEHKYATIDKLFKLLEPKFNQMSRTPRISRVFQSMIKYGSNAHLEKMLTLLGKDFCTFSNDSFASFIIVALLRHAPHSLFRKAVQLIISVLPKIVTHTFGLRVVHAAYSNKLCSATDKNILLLGVFKDSVSIMKHWRGYPILEDILSQEKTHQKRLITSLFNLVDKLVSQKEAYVLPFVQRLVVAFICHGTKHDVMELCITCKPHIAEVASLGKEGGLLACYAFSLLEPKNRKEPLRMISEDFQNKALGKFSAPLVAKLFDLVYDVQLLTKYVVTPLLAHFEDIMVSPYGHLIIAHLVTPSQARRDRIMPQYWTEYNLYSRDNTKWNTHTWLDAEYNEETVEICSKPANKTHVSVLKVIVEAFIKFAKKESVQKEKVTSSVRQHVATIAKEMTHLIQQDAITYKSCFEGIDIDFLNDLVPNREKKGLAEKRPRSDDDAVAVEDNDKPPVKKNKKGAVVTTSIATPKGGDDFNKQTMSKSDKDMSVKSTNGSSKKSKKLIKTKNSEVSASTTPKSISSGKKIVKKVKK